MTRAAIEAALDALMTNTVRAITSVRGQSSKEEGARDGLGPADADRGRA